MTCIIGLKHKDKIYIGGDSAGVSGLDLQVRKDEKVFKIWSADKKDEYLIGFTSSFRMGQLIRYSLILKSRDVVGLTDDMEFLCLYFIPALRECLKTGGYATKDKEEETGGTFILGYNKNLYTIHSDYQVGKVFDPFIAVGCGADYALGALKVLQNSELSPTFKIQQALSAAEHFSAGVRRPFNIISLNEFYTIL